MQNGRLPKPRCRKNSQTPTPNSRERSGPWWRSRWSPTSHETSLKMVLHPAEWYSATYVIYFHGSILCRALFVILMRSALLENKLPSCLPSTRGCHIVQPNSTREVFWNVPFLPSSKSLHRPLLQKKYCFIVQYSELELWSAKKIKYLIVFSHILFMTENNKT